MAIISLLVILEGRWFFATGYAGSQGLSDTGAPGVMMVCRKRGVFKSTTRAVDITSIWRTGRYGLPEIGLGQTKRYPCNHSYHNPTPISYKYPVQSGQPLLDLVVRARLDRSLGHPGAIMIGKSQLQHSRPFGCLITLDKYLTSSDTLRKVKGNLSSKTLQACDL
jgi:hypothetical protein